MTKYASQNVCILSLDGNNLAPLMATISEDYTGDVIDISTFCVDWRQKKGTSRQYTMTAEGWYDDDTGKTCDALNNTIGEERVFLFGVEGKDTVGANVVMAAAAIQVNYNRIASMDDVTRAGFTVETNGAMYDGKLVAPVVARTTAGDTENDSLDNGAASTQGGNMNLSVQALALGGYTSLTVTLRHSTDDITFADKQAFTNVTAISGEQIALTGTINRYTAIEWTWNGSGSSQSWTGCVALHRYPEP